MEPTPSVFYPSARKEGEQPCRPVIDRETCGCLHLSQRIVDIKPGEIWRTFTDENEELLFVVEGAGEAWLSDGLTHQIEAETAILIPPRDEGSFVNLRSAPMRLLSVVSPQPGLAPTVPPSPKTSPEITRVIGAARADKEAASEERSFKLLIDPRCGSRYVTQFMGFIEQSKAAPHKHTYEEVIYVIGGHGIAHLETGETHLEAGACIYLPAGSVHCLENPHEEPLRLVGVFCPSGSPAENYR